MALQRAQLQATPADPPQGRGTPSRPEQGRGAAIRGRFWLACALVVPANLVWVVWALSVNRGGPYFDEFPLLANVVVFLFALAGLNALLRRWRPRWMFSQAELLLLYTVLAISTAVGGSCYGQALAITIAHPFWFGDPGGPGNATADWRGFLPNLPNWLIVQDAQALRGFWTGNSSFYQPEVLRAWATPLLVWTGFIVVLFFGTMCLNVLLRRHWVVHERLTFPIVWLPVEMTRPSGELYRSKLMWLGFALACAPQLVNGLAYLYPGIIAPIGTRQWILRPSFPDPPWSAMEYLSLSFDPMVIGFGFLLPLDLLFSSWFFHLYWQLERVMAAAIGFAPAQQGQGFPHIQDQAQGGLLALGGLAVWGSRGAIGAAWRRAWNRPDAAGVEPAPEALSERMCFLGLALALAAVVGFLEVMGMSLMTSLAVTLLLLASLIALTRIRAESGGPLLCLGGWMDPAYSLARVFGTGAFSTRELTAISLQHWHVDFGFNQPMPYGMEALKVGGESRRSQRHFFLAAIAAVVVGMVGTLLVEMHFAYGLGEAAGLNKAGWSQTDAWSRLQTWLDHSTDPNMGSALGLLVGAAATCALAILRTRLAEWPFHPVPFVVTADLAYYVGFFWMPFLIAWAIKSLILRYRGRPGFQTALPFFFGLILGEMTGGMFWPTYGMFAGIRCYSFFGW